MMAFMAGMEGRMTGNFTELARRMDETNTEVAGLRDKMKENEEGFGERVKGILRDEVRDVVREELKGAGLQQEHTQKTGDPPPKGREVSSAKEDRYWLARRSLRLWPIAGSCLHTEVGTFMLQYLKLGPGFVQPEKLTALEVTPVQKRRPDKCPNEVLVVFPNKAMRDAVRGAASNLGKLPKGIKAGMRLEIPDFLQANFKTLEHVANRIKMSNPDARRNILFDDDALDMALDVKAGDEVDWCRILPGAAKRARRMAPQSSDGASGYSDRVYLGDEDIASLMDGGSDEEDGGTADEDDEEAMNQ